MDITSADFPALVFRRTLKERMEEFSLDNQMLSVLIELDGKKSVGTIASKVGMDIGTIRMIFSKLFKLNLIELVEEGIILLGKDFFDYLKAQLSSAVGPFAGVLIEDTVSQLGHSLPRFPLYRAKELVNLLAQEIQREEKRILFEQNMESKMKEIGV